MSDIHKTLLILFLLSNDVSFAMDTLIQAPPKGSWEDWIVQVRKGASPTPARPDAKNFLLPLPTWVDCHLSWISDQPKKNYKITDEIVLQSSIKLCKNQMENWAL